MNFEIGDTIGSYRLLAECGKGAYGKVFLAESTVTRRRTALKVVCRQGRNCDRELRGLTAYQAICPRTELLQVYYVEDRGEYFYYTMDAADNLAEGGEYVPDTLANRLRTSGRLPADAVRKMADELTEYLNTLHDRGLLHRDVKPDNILWVDGAAKLGDIGLVTADGETVLAGTPGFLPPEVLAGTRGYEAGDDFYALGKAIYCALSGNPVEEYPSFPGSRTLGDCGDLILLYNRLCGGEDVPLIASKGRRWRYAWIAAAVGSALCCGGAAMWAILRPRTAGRMPAASLPETTLSRTSPRVPMTCRQALEAMTEKYAMSAEFEKILPLVMRDYENLCFERYSAGQPEYAPPVSREPPIRIGSDGEDAMRVAKFDRLHENDPVWMFGKLAEAIEADLKSLRNMPDDTPADDDFFRLLMDKCENALLRRKKLEPVLLKKYRAARNP